MTSEERLTLLEKIAQKKMNSIVVLKIPPSGYVMMKATTADTEEDIFGITVFDNEGDLAGDFHFISRNSEFVLFQPAWTCKEFQRNTDLILQKMKDRL